MIGDDGEARALKTLRNAGRLRSYRPREVIFSKGDTADSLAIVESGVVRVSLAGQDGRELALALFGRSTVIGEVAVLDRGERTADAVAVRAVSATVVAASELRRLMRAAPEVTDLMISLLCRRLRSANRQAEGHALGSFTGRLAVQLMNLAEGEADGGQTIPALPSQSELARLVGGARESVNRQLKEWERAGLIETSGKGLLIADLTALQEAAV